MKTYRSLALIIILSLSVNALFAQNKPSHTDSLMKAGIALTDAGKFAEAVAIYDEVLKASPDSKPVLYEKAITLNIMGKHDDAIIILEKLLTSISTPNVYAALGDAYDMKGDFDKATSYYTKGISLWPKDRNLWLNLSVSYSRQKKYPQAQAAAAEAIKADPRHARSYQNYAVAAYLQGKNAEALLGLSNYLMFGSNNQSLGACNVIKSILYAKPNTNADPVAKLEQETIAGAVTVATAGKTGLAPIDSLVLQLTASYKAIQSQENQFGSSFFARYFGDFFGAIATTNYMDTYTRFIAVSLSPQDNIAWLKAHNDDVKAFNIWLNTQKRQTE
ncbi:tetratricopeptide repeat protein [Mucilaginibacter ximonensis]|uniref:Tetratricopeptide repeat protein n=1 Tax=Mucilaginibacter ximonensis TaxID=538021 RepID=A0ABW5YCQ6_9SPHI